MKCAKTSSFHSAHVQLVNVFAGRDIDILCDRTTDGQMDREINIIRTEITMTMMRIP